MSNELDYTLTPASKEQYEEDLRRAKKGRRTYTSSILHHDEAQIRYLKSMLGDKYRPPRIR